MASLSCLLSILFISPSCMIDEPPSHRANWWMGESAPLFAEAIELADLDPDGFRFHPQVIELWGGDRWRLPLFDLFFNDPWTVSPYAREHAANARRSAPRVHDLQYLAQSNTGIRVRDNYYGSFLTESKARIEAEGADALAMSLGRLDGGDPVEIAETDSYRDIPAPVATAAAIILDAIADAEGYRRIALVDSLAREDISQEWAKSRAFEECFWRAADDDDANLAGESKFEEARRTIDTERMLDAIDWHLLARGANLLALATDDATRRLEEAGSFADVEVDFSVMTRFGMVRITGAGSHRLGEGEEHASGARKRRNAEDAVTAEASRVNRH